MYTQEIIAGLLGLLIALITYTYVNDKKDARARDKEIGQRVDQMITSQKMFFEEITQIKEDIVRLMEWHNSHGKRLDKLE